MNHVVIGIDPGKDGALVVLNHHGSAVSSYLTSKEFTLRLGKGSKRDYNESRMVDAFRSLGNDNNILLAVLEKQWARPGQGVSSTFSTGLGYGLWKGILSAVGIPFIEVSPKTWAKSVLKDVSGDGKGRSVYVASKRVPDLDLSPGKRTKPHDGLADAACIALYGLSTLPQVSLDNGV
jgi:crossover junction endodeoxyribonuclease RuvC|tara:strand:+ start:607 stop:1140 length:534 start_codon:yes stop_codon:yes gene_type:complete